MQVLKPHQTKFKQSYEFINKTLPDLPQSYPKVWGAFLEHAKLSDAEARFAVAPHAGAPLIFAQDLGMYVWGQFDPTTPNRIAIGRWILDKFEGDAANPKAQEFLRIKILHEMCHWSCHHKPFLDPDVAGENFEKELFNKEISPWFLSHADASTGTTIFNDANLRAQTLREQLTKPGFVGGREKDPEHKIYGGIDAAEGMPRGVRNNNPGNIRLTDEAWLGLAPSEERKVFQQNEKDFEVFKEPEWGLRAIVRSLRTYKKKGFDTPRKIIGRWAPASDGNNVDSYTGHLAAALDVGSDDTVDADDDDVAFKMMVAIARHENGSRLPYSSVQFEAAIKLL